MSNKTKKEFPFIDVYMKLVNLSGKKMLVLCPEQGIDPAEVECDALSTLEVDKYYQGNIVSSEEKGYATVSETLKQVSVPKPTNIVESKERVNSTLKAIKQYEEELKKQKAESFKEENQIPPIPKDLYISDKVWNLIGASVKLDKYSLLLGPKGCGKTETAKQLAIATGMKYVSFNMGAAFKPKQMFCGMMTAEDGSTKFVESEFLKAFQATEPTLIFLDELTRIPQVATNYLMTILDRNQSYIYIEELGQRVFRGSGVRFICAGNIGSQYTDTRTIDGAFWDRFIKLPVDYLPKAEELKLILKRSPKAPTKAVNVLIDRATKCRDAEREGALTSGISTRQLIDMADYLALGFSLEDVFENVFLNNFINGNNNEIEQVRSIVQS